ncbi:MAG: 4Fe-4S binding protein [Abditibacteriota bacterium]|nr:4Fe-4S binding protein [Abditibacteriota bacterium]
MIRKIIKIDKDKCDGCGLCAEACHEGAIEMIDGKASLVRENFCDGFGDCLPACPTGAITFEEREAPAYDEAAVKAKKAGGCPGSAVMTTASDAPAATKVPSRLAQWPCQIKLVPPAAPFIDGAKLLIAADCTAYAYGNIHDEFMAGRVTIIGCPKLDSVDYSEKLTDIIANNDIKSVTVLRMEVPCCGGIQRAAETALKNSGKFIPWRVVTVTRDGKLIE